MRAQKGSIPFSRLARLVRATVTSPRAAAYNVAARSGNRRLLRAVTSFPRTFHDKVRYKMVRDHRQLVADFADKVVAKDHIARLVGREYLVESLAVYDDAASIRHDDVAGEFVIKVSHASGGIVFVCRHAPPDHVLPAPGGPLIRQSVRPEAFALERARKVFETWLSVPYGVRWGEWAYGVHPPRVLVEPYLRSSSGGALRDIKVHVMNGKAVYFAVISVRDGVRSVSRFWRDGTPLSVDFWSYSGAYLPCTDPPPSLPSYLPEMLNVVERLAAETDYVRVDVLDLGDRFLIGELTNYPSGGLGRFRPRSFDFTLGQHWTVPDSYA